MTFLLMLPRPQLAPLLWPAHLAAFKQNTQCDERVRVYLLKLTWDAPP